MNIVLKLDKTKVGSYDKVFADWDSQRYFEIEKTVKDTWIIKEVNGLNFRAHVATLKEVKESLQQELRSVNA
jgi:hypothetical protein